MDWQKARAGIFRANSKALKEVKEFDEISLDDLIGIDYQKKILYENTEKFLQNKGGVNALLWGERGCGKSSLCKGVFTHFMPLGLKVIEIAKDDLKFLIDILDEIRELPYKFIVYCDDLSFESGDTSYKFLKPILEGSIEKAPANVLIYATTNRRHIIAEKSSDNDGAIVATDELHLNDAVQEKLSLSDRFGIWLSFYQGNFGDYLAIIDNYFKDYTGDRELLHNEAKQYAMLKASRNGRVAKQFYLCNGAKFLGDKFDERVAR